MQTEIVLPFTQPETEWIGGRAVQKMSPTRDHARLQAALVLAFEPWAESRGELGTEWRFRVEPPGEARRPLVPDLAFVSFERIRDLTTDELQAPALTPTIAFEILSPGDRGADVAEKVRVFLRSGSELVIVVDPKARTFALHEASGTISYRAEGVLEHPKLPGFSLALGPFFSKALDRRR